MYHVREIEDVFLMVHSYGGQEKTMGREFGKKVTGGRNRGGYDRIQCYVNHPNDLNGDYQLQINYLHAYSFLPVSYLHYISGIIYNQ
jgi:hypothetical protein